MKKKLIYLLSSLLILLHPYLLSGQNLALLSATKLPEIRELDPEYYQEQVIDDNNILDGVLQISKSDRSLKFSLLGAKQQVLWTRPAPSEWIIMADNGQRIALLGKTRDEGYQTMDGDVIFRNMEVYNISGQLVYKLDSTGAIHNAMFVPDGKLLLYDSEGLTLFGPDGKIIWQITTPIDEVKVDGGGDYLKTYTWNRDPDNFTIRLWKTSTGQEIRAWTYDSSKEPAILYVNPAKNQLLLSETELSVPPVYKLTLYDMNTWLPVAATGNLEYGPFFPAWNALENGFFLLFGRPDISSETNPGEILVGFWDLDNGSISAQSIGKPDISLNTDRVIFNALTRQYLLRIGSSVSIYQHVK